MFNLIEKIDVIIKTAMIKSSGRETTPKIVSNKNWNVSNLGKERSLEVLLVLAILNGYIGAKGDQKGSSTSNADCCEIAAVAFRFSILR